MNTLHPSDLCKVRAIIREIEEKSLDGDYLYRGERKHYKHVSSSLYREYREISADLPEEAFEIRYIQEELLKEAKRHITHLADKGRPQIRAHEALAVSLDVEATLFIESNEDVKILSEVQHYGGKTNLIDFTTDYLIALFFACDGSPKKPGRVILLKQAEVPAKEIVIPQHPLNRILAQKSVFIQPAKGFIDPEETDYAETVCIPACRKEVILEYLRNSHGIESHSVYNDLHGFIVNQEIHQGASKEFCRGLAWQMRADKGQLYTEDGKLLLVRPDGGQLYTEDGKLSSAARQGYKKAIKHYTQAIGRKPDYLRAYDNRSSAYRRIGEYEDAIEDCDVALSLPNPHRDKTYYFRGMVLLHQHEWDAAKAHLEAAKKEGGPIADWFKAENYGSIEDFERIIGAPPDNPLPESIKKLLTGRD